MRRTHEPSGDDRRPQHAMSLHRALEPAKQRGFVSPLERYARFLTRRAWLVLILVGAATVYMALGIRKLRTEFSIEASLPKDHPFVQIDRTIRRNFGGRNTVIIAIVPREGEVWRTDVLTVVRDVTLAALQLSDVIGYNVVSLAAPSVRHVEETGGSITADYLMRDPPQTAEEIGRAHV